MTVRKLRPMTRYHHIPPRRTRRRGPVAGITLAAVLVAGGWWGYEQLSGKGADDPEVIAATTHLQKFLDAWSAGRADAAARLSDSPANAESLLTSVMTNLKPEKTVLKAGSGGKDEEGDVVVPFRASMTIPAAGVLRYESKAKLVPKGDGWTVEFHSPLIHPKLKPGQTLALKSGANRAPVLDAEGNDLEATSLRGTVDENGKGTYGLEARYNKQLSGGGGPPKNVVIADRRSGAAVRSLTPDSGKKGKPVRTTIDPDVQAAAAKALGGVDAEAAALVALQPSTGNILAVANLPAGGLNRALAGKYPPGSTFKVVTAAAMLEDGRKPGDVVECPKFERVNGQRFENQNQFVLPSGSTFKDSFAKSCNTMFVSHRSEVAGSKLHDTAEAFGIGKPWDVGFTTFDGSVPVPDSENELAASTIGQARVQASPLVMASIAATVKEGTFKQPVLVPEAVKTKHEASKRLAPHVVAALRDMMRGTVTFGAGTALHGAPGQPHAKTGTAEFGDEKPPRTHAWMIGFQGESDLAWCVFLEDGGSGGADAGPVAASFLEALGGRAG